MILSGDPAVISLGEDQFLARLQSYLELAPALRERVPSIDYVDLRFDDRIYVRAEEADNPEAEWREENDTWSGSTSAPRR